MGIDVAFWILAVVAVVSAVSLIVARNLFRSALLLVLCFFAVAGIYATLGADFLAVAQVLVYVGAIAVIIIFSIMLTKQVQTGNPFNKFKFPALVLCALFLAGLVVVMVNTNWAPVDTNAGTAVMAEGEATSAAIAAAIFDKDFGFLLPFEIAAVLILAAVIGAIALVREN